MEIKKKVLILFLLIIVILILNIKNIIKIYYPQKYNEYVVVHAEKYNLDPLFVYAIIKAESNFNINAESNKGAVGLMQIMPDTAKWIAYKMQLDSFNIKKLNDPNTNILMGCWYINNLKQEFNSDKQLVLTAYNGGRGNVNKWLNDKRYSKDGNSLYYIPFRETDEYVKKVMVNYSFYKKLYKKLYK